MHLVNLLSLLLTVAASTPAPLSTSDPQGLMQKSNQLFEAMKASDVAALDKLLAPGFVFTSFAGMTATRADFLEVFSSKGMSIDSFKLEPVSVQLAGDAAVVVYHVDMMAHVGATPSHASQLVSTDTWVKSKAGWQLLARHSAKIMAMPQAAPPAK